MAAVFEVSRFYVMPENLASLASPDWCKHLKKCNISHMHTHKHSENWGKIWKIIIIIINKCINQECLNIIKNDSK